MFSQGIDPNLNIENINDIIEIYERLCKMQVHERHPYAGKLVFTAFSGSHQDAINKGTKAMKDRNREFWQVPYLPVDPADIGRCYEPIVRINSQSGKGGVAFIMETYFGYKLPKAMHKEFADVIQRISEKQGEVTPEQIMQEFKNCYLERKEPLHFVRCKMEDVTDSNNTYDTIVTVSYRNNGEEKVFHATGNGPIDAVHHGLQEVVGKKIKILDYSEHALREGANAQAAAYIHVMDKDSGKAAFGVGTSSNITRASLRGLFSAINRLYYL